MFKIIRESFLGEWFNEKESVRLNLKGDLTSAFDYFAEEKVIDFCKKYFPFPVRVLTEVKEESITKKGLPKYTLVIDPIDGATNFRRGIEAGAFSVAVIPKSHKIHPNNVCFGLVGNIFSGTIYKAEKGKGAYCNGAKIMCSTQNDPSKACVGIDLDFDEKKKLARVINLIKETKYFRRNGSGTLDLVQVSNGAYDAYLDVRDKLTPENFLGAYLIIKEAGGIVTDPAGKELEAAKRITDTYNIVASCNPVLHEKLIKLLKM